MTRHIFVFTKLGKSTIIIYAIQWFHHVSRQVRKIKQPAVAVEHFIDRAKRIEQLIISRAQQKLS